MRRPILLAVLAVLALPGAALAAPAKISPHPSAVSAAGVATVEAANPNAYALRGTATVTVGGRSVATRTVRLAKRSVTTLTLRFSRDAVSALSGAGGRATITLRLRRTGGRLTTARRTVRLRLASGTPPQPPSGPSAPVPGGDGNPGTPGGTPPGGTPPGTPTPDRPGTTPPGSGKPTPEPPASNHWVGRMGTEGPYDDFEATVADGQLQLTKAPFVPVYCFENGGSFRNALSLELFDLAGPWTIGTDQTVAKQGIAVNQLVSGGTRSINYKATGTAQEPGRITGTLGMSYFESKYDIFTNKIWFVNCSGSQSFEAVPAG
jgi:hypothetical protein